MIRTFRERPLLMFASGAFGAGVLAAAFAIAAVIAFTMFRAIKAHAFILPGAAMLWFALACYLLMLGLIGETALRARRDRRRAPKDPVVREESW